MGKDRDHTRAVIFVRGTVQGVGFRWWTRARALELRLVGHARNLPDGRVEVVAQGRRADVESMHHLLVEDSPDLDRPGHVLGATVQWHPVREEITGFDER